ncbi:MAG: LemA family protein, partial [Terriglobia bacterium]
MKILLAVLGMLMLIGLILGGTYVSSRNEMVRKNETLKQAWSQVDVVLQRRADLIPNLVATVKGYAQQEVKVFGDVANARAALLNARTPADKIAANGQLDGALGRLLAIVEN